MSDTREMVAERRTVAVTDDQIAAYRRDGAVLVKQVLTRNELALLERGIEEAYHDPTGRFSRVRGLDGRGETMVDQLPSERSASLRAFVDLGVAAQLAARLMGTASAQLVLDQLFYKLAGAIVPTPWHQDTPFLNVRGEDMARVWFSCDPSPRDVTVQVVRGSHRWNIVYDTASMAASSVATAVEGGEFSYEGIGDAAQPRVPDIERHRDSFDILSWDVEPGDAVVFQGNMLHGAAGRDHHPVRRRAFASMWGGPKLRYHAPVGHGMPSFGDLNGVVMRDGAPIGDYPAAFPVGWREEAA